MRMTTVVAALVALLVANSAFPAGMPMMPRVGNEVLATRIQELLKQDPSGSRKLKGSLATPENFFDAIREYHPSANLNDLGELAEYIRSLVKRPAPEGRYRMARILSTKNGGKLDLEGWTRAFLPGEQAYYDPNTGEPILAGDCGNVVGKRIDVRQAVEQCATARYTVTQGDLVRFGVLAQRRLPASACWQLCDGDDCSMFPSPCDDCNWFGPKSVIPRGFEPQHTGLYRAHSEKQSLRFPREVVTSYVALCVEREGLGESDSAVVFPPTWGQDMVVTIPASGFPLWGSQNIGKVVVPAAK